MATNTVVLCNPLGSGSQKQSLFPKPKVNSRKWELVKSSFVIAEKSTHLCVHWHSAAVLGALLEEKGSLLESLAVGDGKEPVTCRSHASGSWCSLRSYINTGLYWQLSLWHLDCSLFCYLLGGKKSRTNHIWINDFFFSPWGIETKGPLGTVSSIPAFQFWPFRI